MWPFNRAERAKPIIDKAFREHVLFLKEHNLKEKPGRHPVPLLLRYDEDQIVTAVFQRAVKIYHGNGKRPPKKLLDWVRASV